MWTPRCERRVSKDATEPADQLTKEMRDLFEFGGPQGFGGPLELLDFKQEPSSREAPKDAAEAKKEEEPS